MVKKATARKTASTEDGVAEGTAAKKTPRRKTTARKTTARKAATKTARAPKAAATTRSKASSEDAKAKRAARRAARREAGGTAKGTAKKSGRKAKTTSRKAKTTSRKAKGDGAGRRKLGARYEEEGSALVAITGGDAQGLPAAAKKLKMSLGKASRLHARATLKSGERLFTKGLSDEEMRKEIVKLVDTDGLKLMPDVWARTGLGPAKIRSMYKYETGNDIAGGRRSKSDKPKGRRGRKAAAEEGEEAAPKRGRKKAARPEPKGRAGGRRARKAASKADLEKVWNLDTEEGEVKGLLEGRKIEVTRDLNGHNMKAVTHQVVTVKTIAKAKSGGKAIAFIDEDQKSRVINLRDITAIA